MHFAGYQRGDDLLLYYASADVFVVPSWYEPWGLVVNEAMAACLPVVATTAVGCVDDLVVHGENGYLVPPRAVDHLRDALQKLASSLGLRADMGRASRAMIAGWTPENYARRVCTVFEGLCAGRSSPHTATDAGLEDDG